MQNDAGHNTPDAHAIHARCRHGIRARTAAHPDARVKPKTRRASATETDHGIVAREAVEACISAGVRERPPVRGIHYTAFVDPSGGSADSMTLAVAHNQGGVAVLDAVREVRPPLSPESVVGEFATLLRSYRITEIARGTAPGAEPRFHVIVRRRLVYVSTLALLLEIQPLFEIPPGHEPK